MMVNRKRSRTVIVSRTIQYFIIRRKVTIVRTTNYEGLRWIIILFFKMADANKRKRLSGFQYRKMSKAKKEREENLVRKTTKLDTYFKIKPNEVHNKVVTDTPTLQVDEKTEEIHNYKINDDMNVDGSNSCDTNETNKLLQVQVKNQINVRCPMSVINVDGKKENEIMSNQVKDQIDIRTVPTSIDFDKKEASQNCKIKNIETNNVDTLETVKCNVKDTNIQYDCWFSNDPAKWVLNESEFEYYSKNQVTTNLVDIQFNKTFRRIGKYNRKLPREAFFRKLLNGEFKHRNWLLYSHSQNSLFCFYCLLFAQRKTKFSRPGSGYIDWKNCLSDVNYHEKCIKHTESVHQIPNAQLLKNLCPTRWSSRHSVCKSIKNGYVGILAALEIIYNDLNQRNAVKHEAKSIYNKIKSLDFVFLLVVWTPLLERFDKTSKSLQLINIDLSCVVSLYDSLVCYIQEQRNNFEIFLSEAIKISGINKFSWEETRTKRRNIFFDEEPSGEVIFSNSDKMKNEAFIPIMDALILQLNKRKEAYTKLCDKFGFFSDMENIEASELRKKALKLVEYYVNDLEVEFVEEIVQFKKYIIHFPNETKNMQGIDRIITTF
ncbi:hypothetical protein ACI65C_013619 [Semiaphis heraclei]